MKKVEMYEARNGKTFNSSEECVRYESILGRVETINEEYNVDGVDEFETENGFDNGEGYIQHANGGVTRLAESLHSVIKESYAISAPGLALALNRYGVLCSTVGRHLCDYDNGLGLYQLWRRLDNTDRKHQEWGQRCFKCG